ncbi:MAG: 3-dehydro-L-gulonate 2-dehydrogenase [Bacteroidota bacterium]
MTISFEALEELLNSILLKTGFPQDKAKTIASIFANSTLDGYHSHGINRFEKFLKTISEGHVKIEVEPERELSLGNFERWDGQLGPGPLSAHFCMNRAIELAKKFGMGCVALKNSNHWMRGGSYGWQATAAGCIGICFTNTEPNMPSWGAKEANTGNNPFIIAIPRAEGAIVLDISLSQFSYGKMQQLDMDGKDLPFPGGYDSSGQLTTNPKAIMTSKRLLPTGYWKGSGLSILLDMMATLLSAGRSTAKIGETEVEYGVSQVFICFDTTQLNTQNEHESLINEILAFVTNATPQTAGQLIHYPGSKTQERRIKYLKEGIPVNETILQRLQAMV